MVCYNKGVSRLVPGLNNYINFVNFTVLELNKLRDPSGFKQFMHQENIKSALFVRYVGNRCYVFFHLAGAMFTLKEKLMHCLEKLCRNATSLRTALLKRFQCSIITY